MKQKLKNNKGITLIALVITIIVMLILVTVTIRVATNGNLFTHAANAVKGTKTAIEGENAILNDDLGIADIVAAQTGEGGAAGAAGEKFSSIYQADANYEDANGKVARIPKGFAVGTSNGINTVAGGLVITDSVAGDRNEQRKRICMDTSR